MGDFNRCTLKEDLPDYTQYVTCATREDKTIDLFYCNIPKAYKCTQRAPLGQSDHNMLHLIPEYRSKLKQTKPIIRTVA